MDHVWYPPSAQLAVLLRQQSRFFNGDATVKAQVKKFYDAVSTWYCYPFSSRDRQVFVQPNIRLLT